MIAALLVSTLLFVAIPDSAVVSEPTPRAVLQRLPDSALVPVEGTYTGAVSSVEARAVVMPGFPGTPTDWTVVDAAPSGGSFAGALAVAEGGWYRIEVRALDSGGGVIAETSVERVGVGEVFVTAGQSNSANHGLPQLSPAEDRVSAHDLATGWRFAVDPQPIATGAYGSPWPPLGDHLVQRHGVPVGFISVGWGGTTVAEWQPGGSLYPRLEAAFTFLGPNGCRAVLWHQGESDMAAGTDAETYAQLLRNVIAQTRIDAGFDLPWGVALASYLPGGDPDAQAEIIAGQLDVIGDPLVFRGASTDDMIGIEWRHDLVHFNEQGLREHALRWADRIPVSAPTLDALDPYSGKIGGHTQVTLTGEGFVGDVEVAFGGKPALHVTIVDPQTLIAVTPRGDTLGPVEISLANEAGAAEFPDAFTYRPTLFNVTEAHVGESIQYAAAGIPGGDWGAIVDYHGGPAVKKGLVWEIGFVDFEIIHDSFRTADAPLNGLGQGRAWYAIPDDPDLVGRTLYAQAIFDGNGPLPTRPLALSDGVQVTILPSPQ